MKFADTLRSAAQSLRAHLTRSSLTVLGLSIGVGASIAIGSLGTAAVREVRGEMSRFGVDRVWVEGNAGNARGLEESDVQALRALGGAAGVVETLVDNEVAVALAAVACPVVNTGVFLIGCLLFFMETISAWADAAGLGANVGQFMIVGLVGANFIFELLFNAVLSPVILRLIRIGKKEVE